MKPLFLACGMLGSLVISGCATTQTTNTANININGSATPTALIPIWACQPIAQIPIPIFG